MGCRKLSYYQETTAFREAGRLKIAYVNREVCPGKKSDFLGAGSNLGTGENAPNSAFTKRGNDVNYQTLLNEFVTGTGPEYSLFTEGHPMVEDLKKSWLVTVASTKFLLGGGKRLEMYDVPFGIAGAGLSYSMTEQFIGGARVSIIPTSAGNLFIINNTTGAYSGSYNQMNDINRQSGGVTPYGNIYQRFIWLQK